jgi:HEPN domain-containing protein
MANRSGDWLRQAEADLRHARQATATGAHDWACFAAHQAAEKAVKSALLAGEAEAWGHSVTRLLALLASGGGVTPDALLDGARLLDRHYIPTRYPDNLPDGAPTDFYRPADAEAAISAAEAIVAHCRRPSR